MLKKYIRVNLILCTLILCLGIFAKPIVAQSFSLSISPPLLEVMIKPGKSITQAYEIINAGSPLEITPRIVSFTPLGEYGNIALTANRSPLTANNWFSFQNADIALESPFLLKSGETKQVVLKISINSEAIEDDYYFTLLFSSHPPNKSTGSATRQAGVIGTNILLTVSEDGQPVRKGEIVELKLLNCYIVKLLDWCLTDSFSKPEFLLRVKNPGRTLWKPFGKIKTEGLFGQKWEEEILPENVLANSIRQLRVATPSSAKLSLASEGKPTFLLGPYKAKVQFNLDEEKQGVFLSAETSFVALPIKTLLILVISILVIYIIKILAAGKKHKKRGT